MPLVLDKWKHCSRWPLAGEIHVTYNIGFWLRNLVERFGGKRFILLLIATGVIFSVLLKTPSVPLFWLEISDIERSRFVSEFSTCLSTTQVSIYYYNFTTFFTGIPLVFPWTYECFHSKRNFVIIEQCYGLCNFKSSSSTTRCACIRKNANGSVMTSKRDYEWTTAEAQCGLIVSA